MAGSSATPLVNCKCFGSDNESGGSSEEQPRKPYRNLVVCIDGTSNQFGPKNTNVIELYSQVIKSDNQLTYYNSGIGTYAKPSWKSWSYLKQVVGNTIDLAIAWNFERIVIAAYRWLSDNYRETDRIYLFGFSRGAYQVRALAGMIEKVGLIHKGNEDQIPFAYELYMDQKSDNYVPRQSRSLLQHLHLRPQPNKREPTDLADRFKATFSRERVRVHFVGVWDTVSSIGIIRGKNLPLTGTVQHVCFFRHALALDERRVKFLPEYLDEISAETLVNANKHASATKNMGVPLNQTTDIVIPQSADQTNPSLADTPLKFQRNLPPFKQVWFPGTHSDIGGGNAVNIDLKLGKTAGLWMSFEAISCGLQLRLNQGEWNWDALADVNESLTSIWRIFEWLPFKRQTYKKNTSRTTYRPNRGRGRQILPGQKIHASVAFCRPDYVPKAILPADCGLEWEGLINKGKEADLYWAKKWEDMLEMDMFDSGAAEEVVQNLSSETNQRNVWIRRLMWMSASFEGSSALIKVEAIPRLYELIDPEKITKVNPEDEKESGLIALGNLAVTYSKQGNFKHAEEVLRAVMEASRRAFGPKSHKTISAMSELAHTFHDSGRWDEAAERHREVLQLRKEVLGPHNRDTMTTTCDLAKCLIFCSKFQEAEVLLEEVIEPLRENFGPHHPDVMAAMSLLNHVFFSRGEFQRVEKQTREILLLRKEILGPRHPDTISTMSSLADTLRQRGLHEQAEGLEREVLSLSQDVLGPTHPATISTMSNLADTLRQRGKYEDAEELEREVFSLRKKILGPYHRDTVSTMSNLALTLQKCHKYEEAEELGQEALSLRKKILGVRHRDTLSTMSGLAFTLQKCRMYEEAEKLGREVVFFHKEVLGPDHCDTVCTMSNLADTLRDCRMYEDAEELEREVLSLRKKILGPDHRDTITTMSNLAFTLRKGRMYEEAEELEREVLTLRKKTLGTRHPDTISTMSNLAFTLLMCRMYEEAEEVGQEALSLHKEILEPSHPDTISTMSNLALALWNLGKQEEAEELQREVRTLDGEVGIDTNYGDRSGHLVERLAQD